MIFSPGFRVALLTGQLLDKLELGSSSAAWRVQFSIVSKKDGQKDVGQ